LRGPQGTAYGANALAGLIAINTRNPQRRHELSANVTAGDFGTLGASGVLGGPVGEGEAAWRLVAGNYRSDGFRHDAYLDRDDTNGYDESSARFKLHTRPSENLSADFTALWADLDNGYDAFAIDNSRTTLSDRPGQDTQLARALAVRLDYSGADAFDVASRTTAGISRSVYSFDGDWGNDAYWGVNAPYDYFQRFDRERRTLSEDLRLVSRGNVDHLPARQMNIAARRFELRGRGCDQPETALAVGFGKNISVDQPKRVARAVERIFRAFEQHGTAVIHILVEHRPHRFAFGNMGIRIDYSCHDFLLSDCYK